MIRRHPLIVAWVAGVLCAVPVALWAFALQLEWPTLFEGGTWQWAMQQAFVHAAVPEESIKLLALLLFCHRHQRPCPATPRSVMQAGAALGLGFAMVETLLHAAVGTAGDMWNTAAVRLVSSIPCHVALGIIMGAFLARGAAWRGLAMAWFVPVLCHGLYNLPLLMPKTPPFAGAPQPMLLSLTVLAFVVLWARDLGFVRPHKIDQAPGGTPA